MVEVAEYRLVAMVEVQEEPLQKVGGNDESLALEEGLPPQGDSRGEEPRGRKGLLDLEPQEPVGRQRESDSLECRPRMVRAGGH